MPQYNTHLAYITRLFRTNCLLPHHLGCMKLFPGPSICVLAKYDWISLTLFPKYISIWASLFIDVQTTKQKFQIIYEQWRKFLIYFAMQYSIISFIFPHTDNNQELELWKLGSWKQKIGNCQDQFDQGCSFHQNLNRSTKTTIQWKAICYHCFVKRGHETSQIITRVHSSSATSLSSHDLNERLVAVELLKTIANCTPLPRYW